MNPTKAVNLLTRILMMALVVTTVLAAIPVLTTSAAPTEDGKIVITLDPGHGGRKSDDGSTGTGAEPPVEYGGVNELFYNLSISLYTKERLEQYENVEVYLTRDNNEDCPGLKERVDIASSYNSDAIISIHNNSSSSRDSHGAEVIVPNKNYNNQIAIQSTLCARDILNTIVEQTGVAKRSIYTRDSDSDKYPNGTKADHFQVIRNGKLQEIPVVMIVECAFVSNQQDFRNHLATEEGLKRMGYALADGLAKYYKLTLVPETEAPTEAPTEEPTEAPTEALTEVPTEAPTEAPTEVSTEAPAETSAIRPTTDGGCASFLPNAVATVTLATLAGALCMARKKKD